MDLNEATTVLSGAQVPKHRQLRTGVLTATVAAVVVVLSLGVGPQPSSALDLPDSSEAAAGARAPAQDADAGVSVYSSSCASCHQPGGVGIEGTFPPLLGNPNVADSGYVEDVIRNGVSGPIDVNGVTYDTAMPAVPGLSDDEIADLSAYVASLATAEPAEPPAEEPGDAVEPGDVTTGRALFTGSDRFANGGGACSGCHVAGSVGGLGGPALGPDLTEVADELGGEAGLAAWLSNPPSPTMEPIFGERPLTAQEAADVSAFLVDAPAQERPSDSVDWLFLVAAIGFLALLGVMAMAYSGMRQTYAERLNARTTSRVNPRMRKGLS